MKIGIEGIASFLPETIIRREEFSYLRPAAEAGGLTFEMFPAERRRALGEDAIEELVIGATRRALAVPGLAPADIDLLICSTIGGRFILPGVASWVHKQVGFPAQVPAWNVQMQCASFTDACALATAMLRAEPQRYRRALVVGACAWNTGTWGVDVTSLAGPMVGDGAAAVVLSGQNLLCEIVTYETRILGEIYPWIVADHRPPEHPDLLNRAVARRNAAIMVVEPPFWPWMMEKGVHLSSRVIPPLLERGGLKPADVDLVVPHQLAGHVVQQWAHNLEQSHGIPATRWRDSWDRYGNVAAADAYLTLGDLVAGKEIRSGANVVMFTPAAAGHNSAMLLKWS